MEPVAPPFDAAAERPPASLLSSLDATYSDLPPARPAPDGPTLQETVLAVEAQAEPADDVAMDGDEGMTVNGVEGFASDDGGAAALEGAPLSPADAMAPADGAAACAEVAEPAPQAYASIEDAAEALQQVLERMTEARDACAQQTAWHEAQVAFATGATGAAPNQAVPEDEGGPPHDAVFANACELRHQALQTVKMAAQTLFGHLQSKMAILMESFAPKLCELDTEATERLETLMTLMKADSHAVAAVDRVHEGLMRLRNDDTVPAWQPFIAQPEWPAHHQQPQDPEIEGANGAEAHGLGGAQAGISDDGIDV